MKRQVYMFPLDTEQNMFLYIKSNEIEIEVLFWLKNISSNKDIRISDQHVNNVN